MVQQKIDWRKEWIRMSVNRAGIVEFVGILRKNFPKWKPAKIVRAIRMIDKCAPVSWNAKDKMIVIR